MGEWVNAQKWEGGEQLKSRFLETHVDGSILVHVAEEDIEDVIPDPGVREAIITTIKALRPVEAVGPGRAFAMSNPPKWLHIYVF